MSGFTRFQCWEQSRVGDVINKEAIAIDLADFMATHAPLGQISYVRAGAAAGLSESDLLSELLRCSQEDRHSFTVIQGIPGTGKSHLIRWLYQRYTREIGDQEVVLLIERAQNSLLGTLRQIIEKIDIGSDSLRQQIEKLRGATDSLSVRAIKDSILDNLRIATFEREESTKGKIRRGIDQFLLDPTVRNFLMADGGPIERIAAFLTSGRQAGKGGGRPEFLADDFVMSAEIQRDVQQQGRSDARSLVEALDLKPELREDLASYLSRLIDYAISRTMALSADDLRQTFNDLRRELRRRKKGLTLFIEDITAFTGIDLGLLDVLVTQHTGESNRDFCRMTSVLGITDSYFSDRFPDNLKERVTHYLTLNSGPADQFEASFIHDAAAAADLAARYLNAMRVGRSEIKLWFDDGARTEYLPNPCENCIHREACHAAFASVNIAPLDASPIEVGLYPFNKQMIWNVYQRLDRATLSRTPRSLLNNIILDVLQTHGAKVIAGEFPPPVRDLAPGIRERDLPALVKPVQQRVINNQGGSDAQRIQTLVLFWGDGTVDARSDNSGKTIGRLASTVFQAFNLRVITGDAIDGEGCDSEDKLPVEESVDRSVTPVSERQGTKYDADIERWRTGAQLSQYEDLRRFLVNFIESSIDWTIHGISAGIRDERIKPGRFEIEGQSGKAAGDRLLFARSDELAYVLQALAELNTSGAQIPPKALGAHLVTLGSWLRSNEHRIVTYVRQPTNTQPSPMPLVELLLLDCLLLDMLCGNLKVDAAGTLDLLQIIIKSACPEVSDRPSTDQHWPDQIDSAKAVHSATWTNLMRNIRAQRPRACRSQLLKQFNLPQGNSSDIRYLDVATAIDILDQMRKSDWSLRTIPTIDEHASATWKDAGSVYTLVSERIAGLISDEQAHQQQFLNRLGEFMGEAKPDEVIRSVESLITTLKDYNIPHTLGDPPAKGLSMRNMLQYINTTIKEQHRGVCAIRISAGRRYTQQAIDFGSYLTEIVKLAERIGTQQTQQIAQLQSESEALQVEERTMGLYNEILGLLRDPTLVLEKQEAQS